MQGEMLGPMQNANYKEYAGNIHDSGRHLLQLINEILDLSRIEAGRYELHEEPVRLTDMVEDCQRLLKLRAESKGLQIARGFDKDLPQIWADERAIRQICLNLLSNALKFTPARRAHHADRRAHRRRRPDAQRHATPAPAFPRRKSRSVMQAFGQGSLAHQTAEGGTGLGLPIVQNLIELHGGTFELRSELRKGTEAIVSAAAKPRCCAPCRRCSRSGQERHRAAGRRRAHARPRAARRMPAGTIGSSPLRGRSHSGRAAAALPRPQSRFLHSAAGRGEVPARRCGPTSAMETPCIKVCVIDAGHAACAPAAAARSTKLPAGRR